MKIKRTKEQIIYRKKLLRLVRLYEVKEIKKKIINSSISNKQIELLLKKNNISLPQEVLNKNIFFLNWNNLYKTSLLMIALIAFFGVMPFIYKANTKLDDKKLANNNKPLKLDIDKFKEKNEVIKFEVEEDLKNQDNTVRLGAATLNEIFKAANYDLDIVRDTKKVKPIYISVLPSEIDQIENSKDRKEIFIKIILPLILEENKKIISNRNKLFRILGKVNNTNSEKKWLNKKLKEYNIKNIDLSELKIRMDIIPVSLAIAQAAKETGWGTSRFAKEGNALFGQWTYSENGLEPLDSVEGEHKVARFNVLQASVRAYKLNLNTHKVYNDFRKARAELREKDEEINSLKLAKFLNKYAETGKQYTEILEKIIKQNSLMDFDQAKLLPRKSIINGNI
ncbi:MAG: glucosaminidase domain-containing protein [Candidatus Pelagibacter sp.]